jgi:tetratricopeptide (TPR) repeat protein
VFADAPRLHPVRVELLEDALQFYETLASQSGADPRLRHEMASVLHAKASLERELDRYEAAVKSLQRQIALLADVVPLDPEPPLYLEELATAERDLALTWHGIEAMTAHSPRTEEQFRKALERYNHLEQLWPDRGQPVALCLRHLAHFALGRGDRGKGERLLRDAIERGEAFCAEYPDNANERYETAWACSQLYDFLTESSDDRLAEAETILERGLRPLAAELAKRPDSQQALDTAAALRIRLAACYARQGRTDEAVGEFRRTIHDMERLCEAFPWNDYYWGNLTWFHQEMAGSLRRVDRADKASAMLRDYGEWLARLQPDLPDEPGPREKWRRAKDGLADMIAE